MTAAAQASLATPGEQRLSMFSRFLEGSSRALLARSGLRRGMHVLDAGCGTGSMTLWIATQVGPRGTVTALDCSSEALETLQRQAHQAGLANIRCAQVDLGTGAALPGSADIVYSRCVLMHLQQPHMALRSLHAALRDGGHGVFEEPVLSAYRTPGDRLLWAFAVSLYTRYCAGQGIDPEYGASLRAAVAEAGFAPQSCELDFSPVPVAQAKAYIDHSLEASGRRYVDAGLIAPLALHNQRKAYVPRDSDSGRMTHFHGVTQLIARKGA